MNPTYYITQATLGGESLLSLCCGIGHELEDTNAKEITAVDIAPQYIDRLKQLFPHVEAVCSDSLSFLLKQPDNSVDIISIIDGIEHMDKETGLKVIEQMKRVTRNKILLFTPQGKAEDGYLKNEPHNAWEIEGADEHQLHKSGWTKDELKALDFRLLLAVGCMSQHGEPYTALMMEWDK